MMTPGTPSNAPRLGGQHHPRGDAPALGGEARFRHLLVVLRDGNRQARMRAIIALGESGDPRAVPPLLDLVDEDDELCVLAVEALWNLGFDGALKGDNNAAMIVIDALRRPENAGELADRLADLLPYIGTIAALAALADWS